MQNETLLLMLLAIPFAGAIAAFSIRKMEQWMAVAMSLIPLGLLFYGQGSWIGASINYVWLPPLSIHFHLSVDALSLVFLYLTAVIVPVSLLSLRGRDTAHAHVFYGLVLLLQGLLIGFFTARDLAVFTVFWESMLIPLYFIINLWGGPQRQMASLKFLIYMIAGSALMVAAVLALYFAGGKTFNLDVLAGVSSTAPYAAWLCAIFLLAFAVKTPLFPFHAWLPDAYCQAPVAGTILLSAILSKAGIYGILRIGLELFPTFIREWSPLLLGFAIAGVFYGGFAAWMQKDFKRLIAYSSFSHVNFVLVGLFVWSETAHSGAILQAVNHGITIAALFLVAGWLEERLGTTAFGHVSGLAKFLPYLCWLTLLFVLSSVALPGTNNFVGELLILFGLFTQHAWAAAFLALSVILSVIYMLRWMQKVYFDEPGLFQESWIDIRAKEFLIALPLVFLILWIGIYPTPVLEQIQPASKKINFEESK